MFVSVPGVCLTHLGIVYCNLGHVVGGSDVFTLADCVSFGGLVEPC